MNDTYQSPFNARYASAEMSRLFSPDMRYTTWRKLWVALAESEMELRATHYAGTGGCAESAH